ncbi:single-stranded DNA-binding protein [Kocuria marina]|uniref:single-stranded DNA-binding protein n=1 Tax=Kocuria marina TaxID=223184 RepID=UPI0022E667D8|nr:single-stranded DNA-binding protein [Kocuria marina]
MSEHVTLRGFVGKDPQSHLFDDGTMAARFRLATTSRRFDAATQTWHDSGTNWYSIRCFRALAMHVMASVHCGQPVVVTGKLSINEWQSDSGPRTIVQVDAAAVGHDLSFGTANFARSGGRNPGAGTASAAPGAGQGSDDTGIDGAGEDTNENAGAAGHDRYRSAQSMGLADKGFVDLTSGAVIAVGEQDHTFDGLTPADPDAGVTDQGIRGAMSAMDEDPDDETRQDTERERETSDLEGATTGG